MKLIERANGNIPRTEEEKQKMIFEAADAYGVFLTSLGFDWKKDQNSRDTPIRVAKAWVNDLVSGCVSHPPKITAFPNEDGYEGMVFQGDIPVVSIDRKSTRLNSSHVRISYAVFCLKKKT